MKNLGNMMKQAQQMQARMAEMQESLGEMAVEGQAGGGMVRVTLSGKSELKAVSIDKALMDPNETEVLEDLIVAACTDAKTKVETAVQDKMKEMTGGLSLPPGIKLPI